MSPNTSGVLMLPSDHPPPPAPSGTGYVLARIGGLAVRRRQRRRAGNRRTVVHDHALRSSAIDGWSVFSFETESRSGRPAPQEPDRRSWRPGNSRRASSAWSVRMLGALTVNVDGRSSQLALRPVQSGMSISPEIDGGGSPVGVELAERQARPHQEAPLGRQADRVGRRRALPASRPWPAAPCPDVR